MRISPPSRIPLEIRTRRCIARPVDTVPRNLEALHIATLEPELFAFTQRRDSTASGARSVQTGVFAYDPCGPRSSDLDAAARAVACLALGGIV